MIKGDSVVLLACINVTFAKQMPNFVRKNFEQVYFIGFCAECPGFENSRSRHVVVGVLFPYNSLLRPQYFFRSQ
jgi:hypothetical protein